MSSKKHEVILIQQPPGPRQAAEEKVVALEDRDDEV